MTTLAESVVTLTVPLRVFTTLVWGLRALSLMSVLKCVLDGQECGVCNYCAWKQAGTPLTGIPTAFIHCPEAARVTQVYGLGASKNRAAGAVVLRPTGTFKRAATQLSVSGAEGDITVAEARLFRFLRLLRWMGTAPWANVDFSINSSILNRLTASHLHLITGKAEFTNAPRAKLFKSISPKMDLQDAQNLVRGVAAHARKHLLDSTPI